MPIISILEKIKTQNNNMFRKGLGYERHRSLLLISAKYFLKKPLCFLGGFWVGDERINKTRCLHIHQICHHRGHTFCIVVNGKREHHNDTLRNSLLSGGFQQDWVKPFLQVRIVTDLHQTCEHFFTIGKGNNFLIFCFSLLRIFGFLGTSKFFGHNVLIKLVNNLVRKGTNFSNLLYQRIKKFSSPKIKIWFEPMFFSGFFCGFERCGSAAFPNFRGGNSSPPQAVKAVRTNSRILHHVGNCKFERFASLRSATNSYSILGVKTNSRFRILGEENFLILNQTTI